MKGSSIIAAGLAVASFLTSCKDPSKDQSNQTFECKERAQIIDVADFYEDGSKGADENLLNIKTLLVNNLLAIGFNKERANIISSYYLQSMSSFKGQGKECEEREASGVCITDTGTATPRILVLNKVANSTSVYVRQMYLISSMVLIMNHNQWGVSLALTNKIAIFLKDTDNEANKTRKLTKAEYYEAMYGLNSQPSEICRYK